MSAKQNTQPINFFNTSVQIPYKQTQKSHSMSFNGLQKVKQLKQHAKQLDDMYQRVLSQKTRKTKSISLLYKNTQKLRVDFLKYYETKKQKLLSRQKLVGLQIQNKQSMNQLTTKVKQRKYKSLFELQNTKNAQNDFNQARQQHYKRQKEKVKKQIKLKNMEQFIYARSMYNKLKQQKLQSVQRNKKISNILATRSQLNYAERMQKQLNKIHQYQDLLEQAERNDKMWEQFRPITSGTKSSRGIFLTTAPSKNNLTKNGTKSARSQFTSFN